MDRESWWPPGVSTWAWPRAERAGCSHECSKDLSCLHRVGSWRGFLLHDHSWGRPPASRGRQAPPSSSLHGVGWGGGPWEAPALQGCSTTWGAESEKNSRFPKGSHHTVHLLCSGHCPSAVTVPTAVGQVQCPWLYLLYPGHCPSAETIPTAVGRVQCPWPHELCPSRCPLAVSVLPRWPGPVSTAAPAAPWLCPRVMTVTFPPEVRGSQGQGRACCALAPAAPGAVQGRGEVSPVLLLSTLLSRPGPSLCCRPGGQGPDLERMSSRTSRHCSLWGLSRPHVSLALSRPGPRVASRLETRMIA